MEKKEQIDENPHSEVTAMEPFSDAQPFGTKSAHLSTTTRAMLEKDLATTSDNSNSKTKLTTANTFDSVETINWASLTGESNAPPTQNTPNVLPETDSDTSEEQKTPEKSSAYDCCSVCDYIEDNSILFGSESANDSLWSASACDCPECLLESASSDGNVEMDYGSESSSSDESDSDDSDSESETGSESDYDSGSACSEAISSDRAGEENPIHNHSFACFMEKSGCEAYTDTYKKWVDETEVVQEKTDAKKPTQLFGNCECDFCDEEPHIVAAKPAGNSKIVAEGKAQNEEAKKQNGHEHSFACFVSDCPTSNGKAKWVGEEESKKIAKKIFHKDDDSEDHEEVDVEMSDVNVANLRESTTSNVTISKTESEAKTDNFLNIAFVESKSSVGSRHLSLAERLQAIRDENAAQMAFSKLTRDPPVRIVHGFKTTMRLPLRHDDSTNLDSSASSSSSSGSSSSSSSSDANSSSRSSVPSSRVSVIGVKMVGPLNKNLKETNGIPPPPSIGAPTFELSGEDKERFEKVAGGIHMTSSEHDSFLHNFPMPQGTSFSNPPATEAPFYNTQLELSSDQAIKMQKTLLAANSGCSAIRTLLPEVPVLVADYIEAVETCIGLSLGEITAERRRAALLQNEINPIHIGEELLHAPVTVVGINELDDASLNIPLLFGDDLIKEMARDVLEKDSRKNLRILKRKAPFHFGSDSNNSDGRKRFRLDSDSIDSTPTSSSNAPSESTAPITSSDFSESGSA